MRIIFDPFYNFSFISLGNPLSSFIYISFNFIVLILFSLDKPRYCLLSLPPPPPSRPSVQTTRGAQLDLQLVTLDRVVSLSLVFGVATTSELSYIRIHIL